jgi:NitT/TauT family transport system permease protein
VPISKWETIAGSLRRLLIWILILSTWEAAYRIVGWRSYILPAPSHVVDALAGMLGKSTNFGGNLSKGWPWNDLPNASGGLITSNWLNPLHLAKAVWKTVADDAPPGEGLLVSLVRLGEGFVVSLLLGILLGLAMWRSEGLDKLLGPLFLGLQTLPSVCWVPVAVLAFGLEERGVLFVLVMGSFFAIAIALRDGLRMIPPLYQRSGLMLGARGWKLYRYVLLPASLPAMASSLRQGFSFAWRSLMGAELILATRAGGLGRLLQLARDVQGDVASVLAVMLVMVLIGMAADRLVFAPLQVRVQRRFGLH